MSRLAHSLSEGNEVKETDWKQTTENLLSHSRDPNICLVDTGFPQITTRSNFCWGKIILIEIKRIDWKGRAQPHHCFLL